MIQIPVKTKIRSFIEFWGFDQSGLGAPLLGLAKLYVIQDNLVLSTGLIM